MKRLGKNIVGPDRAKSCLALLLAVLMVMSMLPAGAFAAEVDSGSDDEGRSATAAWSEDDGATTSSHFTLPVGSAARSTAQDMVECTWFFDNDDIEITWDGDVAQWHMEKTDMRYVEMAIRVNIGTNVATGTEGEDLAAGAVKVTLPYYLPIGRVVNGVQTKVAPWTSPVGDDASGLSISVDEASNEVVVTNRVSIAAGTHKSVVIFYKADCWNIVSGVDFNIGYTWEGADGTEGLDELKGCVFTETRIKSVSEPAQPSDEYRPDQYAYAYKSAYNSQFGLTQAEFNAATGGNYASDPNYVYDLWQVIVFPGGQQPYSIEGTFVPGKYPSKADGSYSNSQPYGWEGELVGAYLGYYSVSSIKIPLNCSHKEVSYDDLPYSGSNGKNDQYITEAKKYLWNTYDFNLNSSQLAIISSFSDVSDYRPSSYALYFLVRYPNKDLDNDGIVSISHGLENKIMLNGTVSITHQGVDSDESVTRFVCGLLYSGGIYKKPTVTIQGKIYSDNCHAPYNSYDAIGSILLGEPVTAQASATWNCYNERRHGIPGQIGDIYTLEGITLPPSLDGKVLGKGDYRIGGFQIRGVSDVSEASGYGSAYEQAKDELVYIYGSIETEGDDDWEELASYKIGNAWNTSPIWGSVVIPAEKNILRLKIVYPSSRLHTSLSLDYSTRILPESKLVQNIAQSVEPGSYVWLRQSIDYRAYLKDDYDQYYPSGPITPDLNSLKSSDSGQWYRALEKNATGIIVNQTIYDQQGKQISVSSGAQAVVTNIGKITYRIEGAVINTFHYADNWTGSIVPNIRKRHIKSGIESPYTSENQQYYVLLPRGMKYLEGSGSVGGANPTGSVTVTTKWLGDRQLLIIDRPLMSQDGHMSGGTSIKDTNGTFCVGNSVSSYPGWGRECYITAVPRNDNEIMPVGNYEALFIHQFLTNDLDRACSLDGYNGIIYKSASEAYKGSEARMIDTYIKSLGEPNLTATSLAFRNRTGSEGSYAMVQVKDGDISHNNGEYGLSALTDLTTEDADNYYSYSLTYTVDSGNSKDVVLWDNIEVYDRNGNTLDWIGTPVGIDTNDTGAIAYVNMEDISIDDYVNAGADSTWLTDDSHGWVEANGSTDWSKVESVAFWFKDQVFDSKEQLGPKSATVYLKMQVPDRIRTNADQNTYLTYNEIGFTDWHSKLQATATVLSNSVNVGVYIENPEPEPGFELPKTGGIGTDAFIVTGFPMMLGAGLLLTVRRRKHR